MALVIRNLPACARDAAYVLALVSAEWRDIVQIVPECVYISVRTLTRSVSMVEWGRDQLLWEPNDHERTMSSAAQHITTPAKRLEVCQHLFRNCGVRAQDQAHNTLSNAVARDDVVLMRWLIQVGYRVTRHTANHVQGVECAQLVIEALTAAEWSHLILTNALKTGNLDLIHYIRPRVRTLHMVNERVGTAMVRLYGEGVDMLQDIHMSRSYGIYIPAAFVRIGDIHNALLWSNDHDGGRATEMAAYRKNFTGLRQLINCKCRHDARVSAALAYHGALDALQVHIQQDGGVWDADVITKAMIHGHRPLVQWAVSHGCPLTAAAAAMAAARGRLDDIVWLRGLGKPALCLTAGGAARAIGTKHETRILDYFLGLLWEENTLTEIATAASTLWTHIYAAKSSSAALTMMRHNIPPSFDHVKLIALGEATLFDMLQDVIRISPWLAHKSGWPPAPIVFGGWLDACNLAAEMGNLACLQALRRLGCPWNHITIQTAGRFGHCDVVAWAVANGCPTTSETSMST